MHNYLRTGLYTSVCIDKPKNDETVTLLQTLYRALLPVIEDLQATNPDGTPKPSAAYTTFFKDAKNMPFVRDMFVRVIQGNSLIPNDQSVFSQGGSPVIWSITQLEEFKTGPEKVDRYATCVQTSEDNVVTAAWLTGSPYILLCPSFWEAAFVYGGIPPAPANGVPASNCPGVSRRGKQFHPGDGTQGASFLQYRMWILLEEILHYYIELSTGTRPAEHRPINTAFGLSAHDSLYNMQSYMYYAASMGSNHPTPW